MSTPLMQWLGRVRRAGLGAALFLHLCLAPALWVVAPAPAVAQTVTERFGRAQRAFNQGQAKTAYEQLTAIAKKYPDHQPTRLLLGRVLFRSGQVSKAATQFKRVSPDLLSGDAAYEFGLTFFQVKDYRRAKQGFARVPSASKLYDLANFYRGLSYYQTRDYASAQLYLLRAKRLPANLQRTRREALSALRRLVRNERQGRTPAATPYVIIPPPVAPPMYGYPGAASPTTEPGPPTPAAPAKPAAPAPPAPTSGFVNAVTPSFTWTQTASNADFFGTKTKSSETSNSALKISFKTKYNGEPRAGGGQPYGSFGVDASQEEVSKRGSSVEYKVYTDRPGDVIEEEKEDTPSSTTSTIIVATPEAGMPVGEAIDIKAGYKYKNTNAKDSGKKTESGPYASIDWGSDTLSLKLTGTQTVTDVVVSQVITTSTVYAADLSKTYESLEVGIVVQQTENVFQRPTPLPPGLVPANDAKIRLITADATKKWESFSMTFAVVQKAIENPFAPYYELSGESGSLKLELSASKTFDFGGSLTFVGASEQLSEYKDAITDPAGTKDEAGNVPKIVVKGSGTRTTATVTMKITPFDWLFASLSLKQTTLALSIADAKAEAEIQKNTAESTLEQTLQAGVTKSF